MDTVSNFRTQLTSLFRTVETSSETLLQSVRERSRNWSDTTDESAVQHVDERIVNLNEQIMEIESMCLKGRGEATYEELLKTCQNIFELNEEALAKVEDHLETTTVYERRKRSIGSTQLDPYSVDNEASSPIASQSPSNGSRLVLTSSRRESSSSIGTSSANNTSPSTPQTPSAADPGSPELRTPTLEDVGISARALSMLNCEDTLPQYSLGASTKASDDTPMTSVANATTLPAAASTTIAATSATAASSSSATDTASTRTTMKAPTASSARQESKSTDLLAKAATKESEPSQLVPTSTLRSSRPADADVRATSSSKPIPSVASPAGPKKTLPADGSATKVQLVSAEELEAVPNYLKSQFTLESVNEYLAKIDTIASASTITDGGFPVVSQADILAAVGVETKTKAFILLMLSVKRLASARVDGQIMYRVL